ncbi:MULTISPECIES: hypothetical protein [unclassified Enterobacter cloacae complex]|uniref:hypothetical protein n=1 Tax=unclassified Enterobacter cloacae complex TaxID=2757714 RepID=UPI0018729403|nr:MULTISPECIES: hypothetical protein [unclassified Enterobacter cloacae complex]MBE4810074.1 hypothetical protein [Enterobacter cloacae complex sp. P44RS]MBE4827942.1 hypothetical protein [Enterobacter cloacae complex sp. P42RS]MBE4836248.1 hypothetical protein [Enterobacter cloacae complex sp. P46RS]MBE4839851.1 hypothetical protein [Enterobacter cloacae complex sp. P42C]
MQKKDYDNLTRVTENYILECMGRLLDPYVDNEENFLERACAALDLWYRIAKDGKVQEKVLDADCIRLSAFVWENTSAKDIQEQT